MCTKYFMTIIKFWSIVFHGSDSQTEIVGMGVTIGQQKITCNTKSLICHKEQNLRNNNYVTAKLLCSLSWFHLEYTPALFRPILHKGREVMSILSVRYLHVMQIKACYCGHECQ